MNMLDENLEGRANRWALLTAFAGQFLRALTPADSVSRQELANCEDSIGQRFPESLIEFYMLCGNAKDVWCRQDEWLKPSMVKFEDGVLVFWVENQGNWRIGVRHSDLSLGDPPVVWDAASWTYGVGTSGEFTILTESVSQFALNMIAYVAKYFEERPFGYTFHVDQLVELLRTNYSRCHLQKEWVCGCESYFQDLDVFIEVNEGDGFVYPIFKTTRAADRFCSLIDTTLFQWESQPDGH